MSLSVFNMPPKDAMYLGKVISINGDKAKITRIRNYIDKQIFIAESFQYRYQFIKFNDGKYSKVHRLTGVNQCQ